MQVLSLNAGSNSLKFQFVSIGKGREDPLSSGFGRTLLSGAYDNIGKYGGKFTLLDGKQVQSQEDVEIRDYTHAANLLFDWLNAGNGRNAGIQKLSDIERVGHRVVHGADYFDGSVRVDDGVIKQIEELEDLAPLHNKSALQVIRASAERLGSGIPMYAAFDTAFHRSISDIAATYALPFELAHKHKIRRYGFHGISHRYLTLRYSQLNRRPVTDCNLITLHLEGGSSAAAIRGGISVDTSMGFTPLEGLVMGTRSGDLDPAILPYLMRKEKLDGHGIEDLLNKKSGLLGVSGVSADTRRLVEQLENPRVTLALEVFAYKVRKYIGAYLAVLGGAHAIVFGGGIGENTPLVREQILSGLDGLGIAIDTQRNGQAIDREALITRDDSRIHAWVIPTEEGLMVAHEAAACTD